MRQPRIKGQGQSFYHCVSRVVEGRFQFRTQSPGSLEAEHFVYLMRRLEKACCVQVLTYALMANHFHILCKVPKRRVLSDRELLDCIEFGYGPERRAQVAEQLAAYSKEPSFRAQAQQLREHYLNRLFDVSVYMKELKGRFAQWYNRRYQRYAISPMVAFWGAGPLCKNNSPIADNQPPHPARIEPTACAALLPNRSGCSAISDSGRLASHLFRPIWQILGSQSWFRTLPLA